MTQHTATPAQPAAGARLRALRPALLLALCLALVVASGQRLGELRAAGGMVRPAGAAARPGLHCLHVLLGGFRGLLTDLLWIRSIRLQERRDYMELAQLAEWIVALEPENGDAWAYLAWNMAYNVSLRFTDPAQRWTWIEQALALLGTRGRRDAADPSLVAAELSWLLLHKVGGQSDPAADHYRQAFARLAAHPVAGAYQLPDSVRHATDRSYGPLDWNRPQAHAAAWAFEAGRSGRTPTAREQADRLLCQALAALFFGFNANEPAPAGPLPPPDRVRFKAVCRAYEQALARTPATRVAAAYATFLRRALPVLDQAPDPAGAAAMARARLEHLPADAGTP